MKLSAILLVAALAFAAEPPKLTEAQKLELSTATTAALRAEVAIHRLKEEYEKENTKRIEAAQKAAQLYTDVVKRLSKIAPDYQLNEAGEFVAKPKPEASSK